ncbi:MAG: class I SAM-dependent methyltransferase [Alkalibacterium sp.]|nr:class I SAM-dependent methyltransferase [Alkalibacterium sp.]TVP93117.1 MAG: class I SAM-dependent methyltransferase [Alkalibacterium sp.]
MNCIICQSDTKELVHPDNGQVFHECLSCHFIKKNSTHHLTSEKELEQYEHHENSIDDPRYVAFFEKFLDAAVFPFTDEGREGLDFGSGPEPVLAQLLKRDYGYNMTIYDLFYSLEETYRNKTFDLITTTEVVEHIPDPLPIFLELKDLMKEDSILAVMTLFQPKDEKEFWNWHYIRDFTHISFFTPEAMRIISEKAGLEIIYCDNHRYTTFRKK